MVGGDGGSEDMRMVGNDVEVYTLLFVWSVVIQLQVLRGCAWQLAREVASVSDRLRWSCV